MEREKMSEEERRALRHDLLGPLQTIRNASYVIRKNSDPETREKMLNTIDNAIDQATKMLEDPLDIINAEKVKFSIFIEEILKNLIIPTNIKITVYPEHEQFYFDPIKMTRVLNNLIKNAIEAMTPNGGILVIKSMQRDYNIITVTDTGLGIPESIMKSIFFAQQTTKKDSRGHGLGLISSRQIVMAHGGAINADNNTEGLGATFTISLPLQPRDPP